MLRSALWLEVLLRKLVPAASADLCLQTTDHEALDVRAALTADAQSDFRDVRGDVQWVDADLVGVLRPEPTPTHWSSEARC